MGRINIAGSTRKHLAGAHATGKSNPDERLEVSLLLRRSNQQAFDELHTEATQGKPVAPLSREEFARRFGASAADLAAVHAFAASNGMQVVEQHVGRRTVVISGTVTQINGAFGVDLQQYEHPNGVYRSHEGPIGLPSELESVVVGVFGLDDRQSARCHLVTRPLDSIDPGKVAADTSVTPPQVAAAYGFPSGGAAGQTIGIIELGGGYRPADLHNYFSGLGLATPNVTSVSVDHGKNKPAGTSNSADGEVLLDIEIAGAIAHGAKIAVYFAPNTDAGFLDAISSAVHDAHNGPSVVSISWGGPESSFVQQSVNGFNTVFQDAATLGVTICVSSGDNGATDGTTDGAEHVDFPASCPNALACGGTRLALTASGSISSEIVWDDAPTTSATGGGVSTLFPAPAWQQGLAAIDTSGRSIPLKNRGVPDVAGNADPQSGYKILVDGTNIVVGGTSAVSPLWAGLIALINARRSTPVGCINPLLYQNPSALNDIIQGNNGGFEAVPGWDACTGLGSPHGAALVNLLAS